MITFKQLLENIDQDPEYDYEGEMAKSQLKNIIDAAQELHDMLSDDANLPGHVIEKVVLANDYIDDARDYMKSEMEK